MGSSECREGDGALGCEGGGAARKRGGGALDGSFFQTREGREGVGYAWRSQVDERKRGASFRGGGSDDRHRPDLGGGGRWVTATGDRAGGGGPTRARERWRVGRVLRMRSGCFGPARRSSGIFDLFKHFQIDLNQFNQKKVLPNSKNFK
jgi:hypothetical protein